MNDYILPSLLIDIQSALIYKPTLYCPDDGIVIVLYKPPTHNVITHSTNITAND